MYIYGNGEIDKFTFSHKSKDVKFQCVKQPLPYALVQNLEECKGVQIDFVDLKEIDDLINMLERFREECILQFGEWRRCY